MSVNHKNNSTTKIYINDSTTSLSRMSSDATNISLNLKDKYNSHEIKKNKSSDVTYNIKWDDRVRTTNITANKLKSVKDTLINDRIDYKQSNLIILFLVFDELKEFYSSNHYGQNIFNLKV